MLVSFGELAPAAADDREDRIAKARIALVDRLVVVAEVLTDLPHFVVDRFLSGLHDLTERSIGSVVVSDGIAAGHGIRVWSEVQLPDHIQRLRRNYRQKHADGRSRRTYRPASHDVEVPRTRVPGLEFFAMDLSRRIFCDMFK